MTVATTTNKAVLSGNGVTTSFPFTFGTLPEGNIRVTLIAADGTRTVLTEGADYTVLGEGAEGGGEVVTTVPPASGVTVLIERVVPLTQPTDYKNQGSFYPRTHERSFDRLTMITQQLQERVDAALTLPPEVSGVSTQLPVPEGHHVIGWRLDEAALENFPIPDVGTGVYVPGFPGSVATRLVAEKLRETVSVEDFGAVGDGVTDDRAAIQAAIDGVYMRGGGCVRLQSKSYAISGGLILRSGCRLVGNGSGQYPTAGNATSVNFVATPKTRLVALAGFPAATPMVDLSVMRGDQYAIQAAGVEGMMIDGAGIAEQLYRWRGVKNSSTRDVLLYRPSTAEGAYAWMLDTGQGAISGATAQAGDANTITLAAASSQRDNWYNGATITITGGTGSGQSRTITGYVGSTRVATVNSAWTTPPDATSVYSITGEVLEGNGATQFNDVSHVTIWLGNTGKAKGMVFNGDGVHDVNQNTYRNVQIVHADGPGVCMYNGDTDIFYGIRTYAFGNGWGCEMYGSDVTGYEGYCRQQFFFGCLFGGANVGANSGTAQAGSANTITLAVDASSVDDYYKNKFVEITGGTGAGQRRRITAYNGTTKVATVDSNWATNPDATSTYTVNGGGGVALFNGTYRASRFHTFVGYETQGNGAGGIYAEDGAAYTQTTERDHTHADTDGFEINLDAANAFATGTSSKINFRRKVRGAIKEMASIREVTTGAEGSETGSLRVFTRKAGATPVEAFRVGDGIQIAGGTALKKLLRVSATIDFASVPANSFVNAPSTVTVTGAAVNDQVIIGLPSNGVANGLMFKAWVSAADTVTVQALNVTGSPIDPGSLSFSFTVLGW